MSPSAIDKREMPGRLPARATSHFLERLITGSLLVSLFVVALAVLWLSHSRNQEVKDAGTTTQNLSKILEQYVAGTVRHIDLALLTVVDEFERQGASGGINEQALNRFLALQQSRLPEIESLRVADARGAVRYGRGIIPGTYINVADRDYFVAARDSAKAGLVISRPMFARIAKKWVMVFARRLNRPDGSFAGVIYVNLALEHFSIVFSGINVGSRGVVSLRDAEMALIARYPERKEVGVDVGSKTVSQDLQQLLKAGKTEGTYYTPTGSDNIARTVSFRRVGNHPLYIIVGLAHDEFLVEWRAEVAWAVSLGALFLLMMLYSSRSLFIAWKRQAESEWQLKTIVETEPECVKVLAPDGTLRQMNRAGLDMIEADSEAQVIGENVIDLVTPEHRQAFIDLGKRVGQGESGTLAFEIIGFKGGHRWLETHAVPMRNSENRIVGLLGVTRDITAERVFQQEIERLARTNTLLLESVGEGIYGVDSTNRTTFVNSAALAMLDFTETELLGQEQHALFHHHRQDGASYPANQCPVGMTLKDGQVRRAENEWFWRKDGSGFPVAMTVTPVIEDGSQVGVVVIFQDITERKANEAKIHYLAFYDPLTRLPNRRLLLDRLKQAMSASQRSGCFGALMFLDLDNFKPLNDAHGHAVGDLLLIEAANRLNACVRDVDTVARFGGDEFVVMLNELSTDRAVSTSQAEIVAEKIRSALSKPYLLTVKRENNVDTTVEHHCTASIGVALFMDHEASQDDILMWADSAMYQAKDAGRDSVQFASGTPQRVGAGENVPTNFVQFTWRSAYKCGNSLIDDQHRGLFGDANRLLGAILSARPTNEVAVLIDVLILDVVQHFKDEEAIISAVGFPGAAEHAAIHRELVNIAGGMARRFHAGTLDVGELFQFLAREMVVQHMLGADREFFPYLKDR